MQKREDCGTGSVSGVSVALHEKRCAKGASLEVWGCLLRAHREAASLQLAALSGRKRGGKLEDQLGTA